MLERIKLVRPPSGHYPLETALENSANIPVLSITFIYYGANGLDAATFVHDVEDGAAGRILRIFTIPLPETLLLMKGRVPLEGLSKFSKPAKLNFWIWPPRQIIIFKSFVYYFPKKTGVPRIFFQ